MDTCIKYIYNVQCYESNIKMSVSFLRLIDKCV